MSQKPYKTNTLQGLHSADSQKKKKEKDQKYVISGPRAESTAQNCKFQHPEDLKSSD